MLQESLDNSFDELEQGKRLLSESKKDVDIMIQQLVGLRRELADSDEDRSLLSKKLQESVEDNRVMCIQVHMYSLKLMLIRMHVDMQSYILICVNVVWFICKTRNAISCVMSKDIKFYVFVCVNA